MEITEMLDELKSKARRDENLRAELLETRKDAQPLSAFCQKCRELGYEIYDMDHRRRRILCHHAQKHQWRRGKFSDAGR